jgi:dUTP pyrophosphatase
MHPRSSLSKTALRLANSTGIIDAGYRGPLIGMFDCIVNTCVIEKYTRLLQICAPNLMPIYVRIIDNIIDLGPETSRGEGGFGSTGKGL